MKNPLHYQLSEYDCGPTSMMNALAYLFEREEIPPEAVRNTMLYCLDCHRQKRHFQSSDDVPQQLAERIRRPRHHVCEQ